MAHKEELDLINNSKQGHSQKKVMTEVLAHEKLMTEAFGPWQRLL